MSTLGTGDCSLKRAAPMARTAAVTMPNPTYWMKRFIQCSPDTPVWWRTPPLSQLGYLGRADYPRQAATARGGIPDGAERLGVVVPLVEGDGPAGANVANGFALGQCGLPRGEGVDQDLARPRLADVHDGRVAD